MRGAWDNFRTFINYNPNIIRGNDLFTKLFSQEPESIQLQVFP